MRLGSAASAFASKIAASYQGAQSDIQIASLIYLGLILLIFSLIMNLLDKISALLIGGGMA